MDHPHYDAEHHGRHEGSHDAHAHHDPVQFRARFWLSLILTLPILLFDEHFMGLFGMAPPDVPLGDWVAPVLGTVLFVYAGGVFLAGAVCELRDRRPGMMTLIALAVSVAFGYSAAVTFGLDGMALWWELATLLVVMLFGHWIEMRSVERAGQALDHLAELVPDTARRLTDGATEEVRVSDLAEGDCIQVRPGERIAADGVVLDGRSSVNEAFLSGESKPVLKEQGDDVVAGAVNGDGSLTVEVSAVGEGTALSRVQRLVADAQASRSRYQALADRAAFVLTLIAVAAGTLTFTVWLVLGFELEFALVRTVTVLVMACPHALGLAIPLVTVNATGLAARHGMLIRNREAFERGRDLRFVAFDKTGTLTEGRHALQSVHPAEGRNEEDMLRLAAALEARSEHPLAGAVLEAAGERGLDVPDATDFRANPGRGVTASVEGTSYRIGRADWAYEGDLPEPLAEALAATDAEGHSAILLADADAPLALFTFADPIREGSRKALRALHDAGIETVLITGDAEAVARSVADDLGIPRVHARVLPEEKKNLVERLREEGATAFVGDGINDAPALLAADLGIAIGAGTHVAIESADVVLADDEPIGVARTLRLARVSYRKMIQNLFWATGYNAVALPLAAGVLYPLGIVLSPAVGALFMSASTVIVAFNAVLLRRADLTA